MKLSVIIPVYNEVESIQVILKRVYETNLVHEIVVVDDGSRDGTRDVLATLDGKNSLRVILHEKNKGKGAAVRTGMAAATGDVLLIQDADLEYDPTEYNILLRPLLDGYADVVFGSRFMGGRPHRILFFWHSIGNKFLTFISNLFTNLNLTDMETCYKLFRSEILKGLQLQERRFGFEPEVTAKMSRVPGVRIYEVGISYYGRSYAEGKKIGWKDGFRAIYCILKYNTWAR